MCSKFLSLYKKCSLSTKVNNIVFSMLLILSPVVQRVDNSYQSNGQITMQWISANKPNHTFYWIVIYLMDSIIHPLKD